MASIAVIEVDAEIRKIAQRCAWTFAPERVSAPIGSESWWAYATDVLAVAHNTRVISMEHRNSVLDAAFEVWSGRTR